MSDKTTKIEDAAELAEIVDIPKAADPDVYTHTFRKPVTYMGATYDSIKFDFTVVTGNTLLSIDREMEATPDVNKPLLRWQSGDAIVRLLAKASAPKVGQDFFGLLPGREFVAIEGIGRRFLMG